MKFLKKQFRLVTMFLVILIFFQSCRVYHRESVTLNRAIKEEKRVKIKTVENKTLKFKKLIFEDGKYYGIKPDPFKYKVYKIPLNQNELLSIRLHNKGLSIFYGISISVISIVVIGLAIVLSSFDLNLDFGGMSAPM